MSAPDFREAVQARWLQQQLKSILPKVDWLDWSLNAVPELLPYWHTLAGASVQRRIQLGAWIVLLAWTHQTRLPSDFWKEWLTLLFEVHSEKLEGWPARALALLAAGDPVWDMAQRRQVVLSLSPLVAPVSCHRADRFEGELRQQANALWWYLTPEAIAVTPLKSGQALPADAWLLDFSTVKPAIENLARRLIANTGQPSSDTLGGWLLLDLAARLAQLDRASRRVHTTQTLTTVLGWTNVLMTCDGGLTPLWPARLMDVSENGSGMRVHLMGTSASLRPGDPLLLRGTGPKQTLPRWMFATVRWERQLENHQELGLMVHGPIEEVVTVVQEYDQSQHELLGLRLGRWLPHRLHGALVLPALDRIEARWWLARTPETIYWSIRPLKLGKLVSATRSVMIFELPPEERSS